MTIEAMVMSHFIFESDDLLMAMDNWEVALIYSDTYGPSGGDWIDISSVLD